MTCHIILLEIFIENLKFKWILQTYLLIINDTIIVGYFLLFKDLLWNFLMKSKDEELTFLAWVC